MNIGEYQTKSGKYLTENNVEVNVIESVTGGFRFITTDHANIHKGEAFAAANKFTLAAGAIGFLEIVVPAGAYVHFKPVSMQSDGPKILIQLVEAPTITTGSTLVSIVNRRRLGTPAISSLIIKNNPTSISNGIVIDQDYIGGGVGAGNSSVSGGVASNDNEWVLKQATTYVIKVINNGSASSDVNVKTFWYEETAG